MLSASPGALHAAETAEGSVLLPASTPFPESVTSTADGTLFVSSISDGGVVRVLPGGKAETFIAAGAFDTRSTFGVSVDEKNNALWVCSNDASILGLKGPSSVEGSYLKKFDLKTGKGLASYKLPVTPAICNDVGYGADGSLYVTNTAGAQIFRLKPGAEALETFVSDDSLKGGLDGIAVGQDGNIYANTYQGGELFRIEVKDGAAGKITKLQTSRPLKNPDALKPVSDGFIMVEGAGPLDHIKIDGDKADVETLKTFAGPTGVTIVGSTAWVSEGQLASLKEDASKRPAFNLRSTPLPKGLKAADAGDDAGISLPQGFKATIFADKLGHARHLAVAADGTVYVNDWSGRYYKDGAAPDAHFLIALKDTKGTGKADVVHRFGTTAKEGSAGGTGIALYKDKLYAEVNDRIEAWPLPKDGISFEGKPEIIVHGMPITGDHPMHPFVIGEDGSLYVDLGSASNSCQPQNRMSAIPGTDPCTELETRGGIWRYDANKINQAFSPKERFSTGLRNGEGLSFDSSKRLFATQHGRDQLSESWGKLYTPHQGAELPAEEVVELKQGADFGWPYCYYDQDQKKLVLAPEYGGDGGKKVGVCAEKTAPVAAFPGHWAPNDLAIYTGKQFPKAYQDGAFIAFHGSWNRAPSPQAGYNVVFQPLKDGKASGPYVVFADGFAGATKEPGRAAHRPSGLAIGPDGALFVSDDQNGRVYRITYEGSADAAVAAAPDPQKDAKASETVLPPEGLHADAGAPLAVPPGSTKEQVARGQAVFSGEGGGTCAGCHGGDAAGGPIGPDLTGEKWLWADGSLESIHKVIAEGVPTPKTHPGAMPPKGGADLSDADLDAVSAFVWSVSRNKGH